MLGIVRAIRYLASAYQKLPVKPFRGGLNRLYRRYRLVNRVRDRVLVATVDGITYELDLNELIDSSIYYFGCFEPMTTAIINKYVKPGMTVLDIGANVGCHTLRMAKLVGERGKVIAFEPMSHAFLKLKRNIALNNFTNIVSEKLALSDISETKPACFYTSWPLEYEGGLLDSEDPRDCFFITLDEYVTRNNIGKIDFMKLDVDGYEYKVIRGG